MEFSANGRNSILGTQRQVETRAVGRRLVLQPASLTLPEGGASSVQRSRTLSGSPLLAPMAQLTWLRPLGTRAGGLPGAEKTPFPLPLAPPGCLVHHSTSHSHPADTVARSGLQWPAETQGLSLPAFPERF